LQKEAAVLDLVVWAFVTALVTPLALSLAWKLISGIGKWLGFGVFQVLEDTEPRRHLHPLVFDAPSGSFFMTGKTRRRRVERSPAPHWRRFPEL
jgi:hypothetical protein